MSNARQADQAWFALQEGRNPWEWGLGAGSVGYGSGYHADAIHNNSGIYCSPISSLVFYRSTQKA